MPETWLIVEEYEGYTQPIGVYRSCGTVMEIKKTLAKLASKKADEEKYDKAEFVSDTSSKIVEEDDGTLSAIAMFHHFRVFFTAIKLNEVREV